MAKSLNSGKQVMLDATILNYTMHSSTLCTEAGDIDTASVPMRAVFIPGETPVLLHSKEPTEKRSTDQAQNYLVYLDDEAIMEYEKIRHHNGIEARDARVPVSLLEFALGLYRVQRPQHAVNEILDMYAKH